MGSTNTRLLAAVMFTDIVGYSAMMQEDETKANSQRDRHRQVLEKRTSEFDGKILHYYGDGALTIFKSAFNAVMCGLQVQQDLQDPVLPLRMGIHMGDIVYSNNDVHGDAVNIASRLESLSVAGGILFSRKVKEEIKNHRQIKSSSLGTFELKNIQQPMEIFAVSNEGIRVPTPEDIKAKSGRLTKRIAVLPFVNMSDELGFDFFGDGLTEEIINGLTKMEGLDVTARTSAFAFKGRNEDVRSIGEKLSVSHVLEGSVRKNKNKIRVTAQLIETERGFHLWSETYERPLKDIFEIQDTISEQIIEKFREGFVKPMDDKNPSVQSLSENQRAYDLYLEGTFQWNKWTIPSVRKALTKFKNAVNEDPQFVNAYIKLANCYVFLGIFGQMTARLAFEKAEQNVRKALNIDDSSANAYSTKGIIQALYHHEYARANDLFTRAFEIDDQLPELHHFYSIFLTIIGDTERALQWMERALIIEPSSLIYNSELGRAYLNARRYSEALEQFNYTLELEPSFLAAIDGKGWAFVGMGEYKNAHNVFEIFQNLVSQEQKNIPQLVYIAAKLGMEDVARHFLDLIQLGGTEDSYITTPVDIALIYLGLEKYDEVFFHLQRAVDDKIGKVMFIPSDPAWDEIKDDKRYGQLLEQLNLEGSLDIHPLTALKE